MTTNSLLISFRELVKPIEIMHEHRAMRVTVIENDNWDSDDSDEVFSLLKINEIYFDALLDLK